MRKNQRRKMIFSLLLCFVLLLSAACSNQEALEDNVEENTDQTSVEESQEESTEISLDAAKANFTDDSYVFVDTRLSDAYNGWALDGISRGGHIPQAVDFPYHWTTLEVENRDEKLEEVLEAKGITPDKNVVVYDTNGQMASVVFDYLKEKGYENIQTFDLNLWINDESLELVKFSNFEKIVPASVVKMALEGEQPETFDTADIKVVEASWGPEDASYAKGHVPGTFHINTDLVEPEPEWMLASDEELESFALDYGFTKDDTVIVTSRNQMAAYRVAVVLEYMGVKDVRVLNGGLGAWERAGYDVETESHQPSPVESFGGSIPMNPEMVMTIPELKNALEKDTFTLVDNRTWDEHIGESTGYTYHDKKGRIPGAVYGYAGLSDSNSLDYFRNIDGTMRNPNEIKGLWQGQNIDLANELAFMCGSGWRAAEVFTYARVMGLEDVSLYSDGWIGWSNDLDNPIETGVPTSGE